MRKKLIRFQEIGTRDNILESNNIEPLDIKGKWKKEFFKNDNPLVLELGCGRGEYSVGLAKEFPQKNFIGIDVKGDRIWFGSTLALENGLSNVGFLRAQIQHLEQYFDEGEVSEIWITFPDPRPKIRDAKRRLTSPRFLNLYKNILTPQGIIHLKTDNTPLFEYTLEVIKDYQVSLLAHTVDLYNSSLDKEHLGIKTRFEKSFFEKGFNIKYLRFFFN